MSSLKFQDTSTSTTLISALQWQLAIIKAFPENLCRNGKDREIVDYFFTGQDLRWSQMMKLSIRVRAVQKTCTKTYGRKGIRSGGHHLLIFSHFFRSNKKKNCLILSHFDSVKAPENISVLPQLLSEEYYRLCLSLYIHNVQTFTICHCFMVDGILYTLPQQKRSAAGN